MRCNVAQMHFLDLQQLDCWRNSWEWPNESLRGGVLEHPPSPDMPLGM